MAWIYWLINAVALISVAILLKPDGYLFVWARLIVGVALFLVPFFTPVGYGIFLFTPLWGVIIVRELVSLFKKGLVGTT